MISWLKRWGIPFFAALVLLGAVTLQLIAHLKPVPESSLDKPLEETIPAHLAGWQVTDLDLGPTESVRPSAEPAGTAESRSHWN